MGLDKLDSKAEIMVNENSDSEEEDSNECTATDELTASLVLEVCEEDSMDIAVDIKPFLRLMVV